MSKQENIHIRCCTELREYVDNLGGASKGVYEMFYTHRDLNRALKDGGLESLEPSDLVGLIRCLVNDKKRRISKPRGSK